MHNYTLNYMHCRNKANKIQTIKMKWEHAQKW